MAEKNPYLILCTHCGELICYKCAQFEDRSNSVGDGESDDRYGRRLEKKYREHRERYEHLGITRG